MADLGDYVESREKVWVFTFFKKVIRGHVVGKPAPHISMIETTRPMGQFVEVADDNLTVLVKGKNG